MTKSKRREPAAAKRWTLRLLGDPALFAPDGSSHALERRAAALFALAFLEPGISRRRAATLLWPDSGESNARQALRQQLLRLKKLGGGELLEGEAELRLAGHVEADVDRDDAEGVLLGAFDYGDESDLADWVELRRSERRQRKSGRLGRLFEEAEAAGDREASLRIAERLLAADPDNERHHRSVMRAHYLGGDTSRAQAAYERLRAMLEREFGAKPSAETEQLARSIRAARGAPDAASASRSPPPSVLRPPRLIGREREWRMLEAAWGAGEAAIVTGVAGLGKSRLIGDFGASRGKAVVVAARPGDALVAYSLLARVVRQIVGRVPLPLGAGLRKELARLLPELGEADPIRDAADLARLLRAIENLLEQALSAGLAGILLDDVHYADAATLDAFRGSIATDRRLPLVLACRSDEIEAGTSELANLLFSSGGGRTIELAALTVPQVAELLESLDLSGFDAAGLAPDVARHTGGNPLFVLETVKLMLQEGTAALGGTRLPVAANVTALIDRRLARLSRDAVALARCAAVAGQDFSAELAVHVLGARALDLADAWAELEVAHVLRGGAFAHDLIYEATLASVPAAIARNLHGQIAAFLASDGTEPARVAAHWEAARRHREAGAAFVRAAAVARGAGRRMEEADLLARAAGCLEECGDLDARFEALLSRAEAMICIDLGEATLESVHALEAAARDDGQRLLALLKKAECLDNRSESEAAVEAGRAGIELSTKANRPDLAAQFSMVVGAGLCELRRVDEALALLEPLGDWSRENLASRPRVDVFVRLGIAFDLANRLGDALGAFEYARKVAAEQGHKDLLATALSNLATTTSKRGHLARAVDFGRQALQLWRESESLRGTPLQTQALLAHRLRDLGHYDEAIPMLEEAMAEFRRAGTHHWLFATAHRLALAYSQAGQHARAVRLMAEDPAGQSVKARAMWMAHRAEVARVSGGDAMAPIRAALALLGGEVDDGNNRLVTLMATAIVPPAEGEPMAIAVAAWAAARERFGMAAAAHARAAGCALAQDAIDRAIPQAEAAVRLFSVHEPDNFYRAEIWWVAAQVFQAASRRAEADHMLALGRDWITRIAAGHLPEAFRDGFLHRNPVNRALLSAALRLPPPTAASRDACVTPTGLQGGRRDAPSALSRLSIARRRRKDSP